MSAFLFSLILYDVFTYTMVGSFVMASERVLRELVSVFVSLVTWVSLHLDIQYTRFCVMSSDFSFL